MLFRRTAAAMATAVCVVAAVGTIASFAPAGSLRFQDWRLRLVGGAVEIQHEQRVRVLGELAVLGPLFRSMPAWNHTSLLRLAPICERTAGGLLLNLPLWMIIAVSAWSAHMLRSATAIPGTCRACRYDLASLPNGSPCPECGSAR